MKKSILLSVFIVSGCTTQWASLTTKSVNDLEEYKNAPVSEFIWNRYITGHDTAGIGYLNKGMDLVISGIETVAKEKTATFYDISRDFNLHKAFYNLADYSSLLKPKQELENLCKVKGGEFSSINMFKVNIPGSDLDLSYSLKFIQLASDYINSEKIAKNVNDMKLSIDSPPSIKIPIVVTADKIQSMVLRDMGKLEEFQRLRDASNIDIMLSGDMAIAGEGAFGEALSAGAFGDFNCTIDSQIIWSASIRPLWNEVNQQTMTNALVLQIVSSDMVNRVAE